MFNALNMIVRRAKNDQFCRPKSGFKRLRDFVSSQKIFKKLSLELEQKKNKAKKTIIKRRKNRRQTKN